MSDFNQNYDNKQDNNTIVYILIAVFAIWAVYYFMSTPCNSNTENMGGVALAGRSSRNEQNSIRSGIQILNSDQFAPFKLEQLPMKGRAGVHLGEGRSKNTHPFGSPRAIKLGMAPDSPPVTPSFNNSLTRAGS